MIAERDLLDRFERVKRLRDGEWMTSCPAHPDRNPSLHVTLKPGDRWLLSCQAGCETEAVLAAAKLDWSDLFEQNGKREIVAEYDYTDEQGELLYQVVRFYPKDFRQRRPDGNDGWEWKLDGTRRVLYRLPKVIAAVERGEAVWICEGEKDVLALERAGVTATTCPMGAGKWRDEYGKPFAGATAIIIADRDDAGRKHAAEVAKSLEGVAAEVVLAEPAAGKDVTDHFAADKGLEDFKRIPGKTAPSAGPAVEPVSVTEAVAIYQRHLHLPDPEPLYVCWGTIAANRLPVEPVWLLEVDVSGGGKTEVLRACSDLPECAHISSLTEAGLLSGTAHKERSEDATGGVLRVIGKRGVIVAKDFTSVLAMERNSRGTVLAALREVYDGHYVRQLGTDGGRTLQWRGKAGFIGGVTPDIDSQYLVMARLGQRFLLHRPVERSGDDKQKSIERSLINAGRIEAMREELREAALGVFAGCKESADDPEEYERDWLVKIAMLVAPARAGVVTNARGDVLDRIEPELPTRLAMELAGLLAGMDVIGVEREAALRAVGNTALGCIPAMRRRVLGVLEEAEEEEELSTRHVAGELWQPTETASRVLKELTLHGLVERDSVGKQHEHRWKLAPWARERLELARRIPTLGFHPEATDVRSGVKSQTPAPDVEAHSVREEGLQRFAHPLFEQAPIKGCAVHRDDPQPGCRYCNPEAFA